MSLGSKKSTSNNSAVSAPPQITNVDFTAPDGNRYLTQQAGNTLLSESYLNPRSKATLDTGLDALQSLSRELNEPDARRAAQINDRARDFYDLQAGAVNAEANRIREQAESDLAKRFGGTYNATFGADYLARIERNRQAQLYETGKEAALYGEDLYRQDETSRLQRFQLFSNYLVSQYNQSLGAATQGYDLIQDENNRIQDLGKKQALAVQNKEQSEAAERQQRLQVMAALAGTALLL